MITFPIAQIICGGVITGLGHVTNMLITDKPIDSTACLLTICQDKSDVKVWSHSNSATTPKTPAVLFIVGVILSGLVLGECSFVTDSFEIQPVSGLRWFFQYMICGLCFGIGATWHGLQPKKDLSRTDRRKRWGSISILIFMTIFTVMKGHDHNLYPEPSSNSNIESSSTLMCDDSYGTLMFMITSTPTSTSQIKINGIVIILFGLMISSLPLIYLTFYNRLCPGSEEKKEKEVEEDPSHPLFGLIVSSLPLFYLTRPGSEEEEKKDKDKDKEKEKDDPEHPYQEKYTSLLSIYKSIWCGITVGVGFIVSGTTRPSVMRNMFSVGRFDLIHFDSTGWIFAFTVAFVGGILRRIKKNRIISEKQWSNQMSTSLATQSNEDRYYSGSFDYWAEDQCECTKKTAAGRSSPDSPDGTTGLDSPLGASDPLSRIFLTRQIIGAILLGYGLGSTGLGTGGLLVCAGQDFGQLFRTILTPTVSMTQQNVKGSGGGGALLLVFWVVVGIKISSFLGTICFGAEIKITTASVHVLANFGYPEKSALEKRILLDKKKKLSLDPQTIASTDTQVAMILMQPEQGTAGRKGRNGKNDRNGKNGRNSRNNRNGRNDRNDRNGRNGRNGGNGKNVMIVDVRKRKYMTSTYLALDEHLTTTTTTTTSTTSTNATHINNSGDAIHENIQQKQYEELCTLNVMHVPFDVGSRLFVCEHIIEIESEEQDLRETAVTNIFGRHKDCTILFYCDDGWISRLCCDRMIEIYGYANVCACTLNQLKEMKFWNRNIRPVSLIPFAVRKKRKDVKIKKK